MPLFLTDCHAHLADWRIAGDAENIVKQCQVNGVVRLLLNGTNPADWESTMQLAQRGGYDCALGLHPFFAQEWGDNLELKLRGLLQSGDVRAIGEIGLDGTRQETMPMQLLAFARQLELAVEYHLPVSLHLRNAWKPFFSVVERLKLKELSGYCHNFTGAWEVARPLLELGLHLSFNTPVYTGRKVLSTIEKMPLERMLTESDTPDLPMHDQNQSRPWHTQGIVMRLAELRHCNADDLSRIIVQNYDGLFKY